MAELGERRRVKRKVKRRVRRRIPRQVPRLLVAVMVMGVAALFLFQEDPIQLQAPIGRPALTLNDQLFDISPNTWVKLRVGRVGAWTGDGHAGAVFDHRRNKVFVFGSGFEGRVWDNAVHEFDPTILQWSNHEPPARRPSYRTDDKGHPVSGQDGPQPWAMQVYGGLTYDPSLDALVIVATPDGNPALRRLNGEPRHPVWLYELASRRWRAMDVPSDPPVVSSGGAVAYDPQRDTLVVYNEAGIWEMGPDRKQWVLASRESHHRSHHKLVYDSRQNVFAVFGGRDGKNEVWTYRPGAEAGQAGTWVQLVPEGEDCPFDQDPAVAFDPDDGVFLQVVDAKERGKEQPSEHTGSVRTKSPSKVSSVERLRQHDQEEGATCVYDLQTNTYRRLPKATPPLAGKPHVLIYDPVYKVFFLMGKDSDGTPSVWVMSLELALLDAGKGKKLSDRG